MATDVQGTTMEVEVVSVVDGDTVKVDLQGEETNVRILALDTEESWAGSGKPQTPWGIETKKEAQSFFPEGGTITLEFPGDEPVEQCLERYRDNYGRPMAYVHYDGEDFQERMINQGYSPYFTKYGYAHFDDHHRRYREAERRAQADDEGVWNQLKVNGQVMRNYSTLSTWWELRAEVVQTYRRAKREGNESLLDSRLDYDEIAERVGERLTVFTELRTLNRAGESHIVVDIGSRSQPFTLFVPDARETEEGQRIVSLLNSRYVPQAVDGRTVERPHRSYAYVTGEIALYRKKPRIVITSIDQITDDPPSPATG